MVSHWAVSAGFIAAILPNRPPHLGVIHSADVHALERLPGGAHLARKVATNAEALLFVSEDLRRRFLRLLGEVHARRAQTRMEVSPMGVADPPSDPIDRKRARRELGIKGFTALSLGRLVAIKGIEDAIHGAARVDVALWVAGEGPERPRLERLASTSGARVRFVGHVTGTHKQALLSAADAFVLPSRRLDSGRTEGTPTALLEAMAAGLVPVAAGVGGVVDLIDNGVNGLLFEHGRDQQLGLALARLRSDAALRHALSTGARDVGLAHTWSALRPRIAASLEAAHAAR